MTTPETDKQGIVPDSAARGQALRAGSWKKCFANSNPTLAFLYHGRMQSNAFIAQMCRGRKACTALELLCLISGVMLVALCAEIQIVLPFTPVPVTGQTFGVSLIGLLWGFRRAGLVLILYLLTGALGLPTFAGEDSSLTGPTAGYLLGMLIAAMAMGVFADRGWAGTFIKAFAVATIGTVLVFAAGAAGLMFFLPTGEILAAGVWPFVPGAIIKNALAAAVASGLYELTGVRSSRSTFAQPKKSDPGSS